MKDRCWGMLWCRLALACIASVARAQTGEFHETAVDVGTATLHKHVVYDSSDPSALVLNAFVPKSDKPSPVFIQIKSGGWHSKPVRIPDGAERAAVERFAPYFEAGFSVVLVSHRTIAREDVRWPDPMNDVTRAVQFLRHRAKEWNIDPNRISISGRSSGSHIAEMVAYTPDRADPDSDDAVSRQSSRITCVIAYAGTANLAHHFKMCLETGPEGKPAATPAYMAKKLDELFGLGPEHVGTAEMDAHFLKMSPTSHLHKDCPPTLLVHTGPADAKSKDDPRLVWDIHTPINGFLLAKKFAALGVPHELVLKSRDDPDRIPREIAFLKKHNGIESSIPKYH